MFELFRKSKKVQEVQEVQEVQNDDRKFMMIYGYGETPSSAYGRSTLELNNYILTHNDEEILNSKFSIENNRYIIEDLNFYTKSTLDRLKIKYR